MDESPNETLMRRLHSMSTKSNESRSSSFNIPPQPFYCSNVERATGITKGTFVLYLYYKIRLVRGYSKPFSNHGVRVSVDFKVTLLHVTTIKSVKGIHHLRVKCIYLFIKHTCLIIALSNEFH